MNTCVCDMPGRGSGVIQVGPMFHPCCVRCPGMRGKTFAVRAAAEKALKDHRRGHGS